MIKVTKENFDDEVLKASSLVLADFNADWCGPCRMISPVLEELEKEAKNVKFVSINVDDEEDIASKYGVMSIPCLIVFKDGNEKARSVGLKSRDEIKALLED